MATGRRGAEPEEAPAPEDDSQILAAFNAWNEAAARHPRWPKAQNLSPVRHRALKTRIDDAGDLDAFLAVLAKAEGSRFIREEMKGWSLDWFLKAANFTKVSEGNYDDPAGGVLAGSAPREAWAESLP